MAETAISPQAAAILEEWCKTNNWDEDIPPRVLYDIAVVLRATADQVLPMTKSPWGSTLVPVLTSQESRKRILAIADELEGAI